MKTVKLYYGSSMVPDWSIFETRAELPELLKFCFAMELGLATLPDDEVKKIKNDFEKKYHFKLLTWSEEWNGNIKAKADIEIDLDDFIEILEKHTINFNF